MYRISLIILFALVLNIRAEGRTIVADSLSRTPLSGASVFDRKGRFIGISGTNGALPPVSGEDYPLTVRYMGFMEKRVPQAGTDTVLMQENVTELRELVVESEKQRVLHILAYAREYSTLTTYSDTVTMFREKMVDYMIPSSGKTKFKGWRIPRILKSKSYYRFSNNLRLDSVSDRCRNFFSWSDWVGLAPVRAVPRRLQLSEWAADTLRGKYSASEIWTRKEDRIDLNVDVLADSTGRKWVPGVAGFFRNDLDFEQFRLHLTYDNVVDDSVSPLSLSGYSFNIESNGRGRGMFMFNRRDEPFFVSTYGEVYPVEKEFISVGEAKKWDKFGERVKELEMIEPAEAPELQPEVLALISRVNELDHVKVRLDFTPDHRLAGREVVKLNAGQLILNRLKGVLGIDHINARRKWKKQWREFRDERREKNKERTE